MGDELCRHRLGVLEERVRRGEHPRGVLRPSDDEPLGEPRDCPVDHLRHAGNRVQLPNQRHMSGANGVASLACVGDRRRRPGDAEASARPRTTHHGVREQMIVDFQTHYTPPELQKGDPTRMTVQLDENGNRVRRVPWGSGL